MIRKLLGGLGAAAVIALMVAAFVTNHSYVTTPSMYPTIPPGSEIIVSHATSYHVGEVIEFHANGLTWAHRLVKINPDGTYVTKGDNPQNAPDVFVPALTRADVVGVVTHAPRWLGFPELIAHHPSYGLSWLRAELGLAGKFILVGLVGVVFLLTGRHRDRKAATGQRAAVTRPEPDSADAAELPATRTRLHVVRNGVTRITERGHHRRTPAGTSTC